MKDVIFTTLKPGRIYNDWELSSTLSLSIKDIRYHLDGLSRSGLADRTVKIRFKRKSFTGYITRQMELTYD